MVSTTAADITQNYMNITLDLCALKHEDFIIRDGGKKRNKKNFLKIFFYYGKTIMKTFIA